MKRGQRRVKYNVKRRWRWHDTTDMAASLMSLYKCAKTWKFWLTNWQKPIASVKSVSLHSGWHSVLCWWLWVAPYIFSRKLLKPITGDCTVDGSWQQLQRLSMRHPPGTVCYSPAIHIHWSDCRHCCNCASSIVLTVSYYMRGVEKIDKQHTFIF